MATDTSLAAQTEHDPSAMLPHEMGPFKRCRLEVSRRA